MTIWFTSDPHISHKLVAGLRGFWRLDQDDVHMPNTQAHDDTLALHWDAVVAPEDTVWVLGDMSINSGKQVAPWIAERPGTKHLVSGNHDKTHTGIFSPGKSARVLAEWSEVFESIQNETVIELGGKKVTLSHFPFWSWGDGPEVRNNNPNFQPRYEKFRPAERPDTILLHGHTHSKERDHERSYHVGLDAHGLELVSEQTILDWLETLD
ncbi:MAG: metallophosphoesterase family protein [Cetobacterium sp.]